MLTRLHARRGPAAAWILSMLGGVIAARGLFATRILAGHDALIYITRLVEFDDSVRYGILLPRWAPHLGAGHGEPLWVFVPPLMQALSEIAHLLGANFIVAENIALQILFFFGGAMMHILGKRIGAIAGSMIAATSFFFAPYVLVDLYVRHAAAEFAAVCFLPLIALAFHRIGSNELRGSTAMLAAGIAGVGFSHDAVLLIVFPICVAAAIAMLARGWIAGGSAITGVAIGLGIATWSWLPALIDRRYGRLDLLRHGYFTYSNHFATLRQIAYSPWGFGYSHSGSSPLTFTIGPILIVVAVIGVVIARRRWEARGFAAAAVMGIFLSTGASALFWAWFPLLQHLAFPWRFLILPSIAIPPLAAFGARRFPIAVGILVLAHVAMYAPHAQPQRYLQTTETDRSPIRIASLGILDTSLDEYRPRWVEDFIPFSPDAFDPPLLGTMTEYTPVHRRFDVFTARPLVVRLQIFYFPGWGVEIDGRPVPVRPSRHTGLIEFMLPAGRHDVDARFSPTPVRAASAIITLISLAAAVLLRDGLLRSAEARREWPSRLR